MKRIALIGCTGSIGRQACDVVRRYPDEFCFSALVCGRDRGELFRLKEEFACACAYTAEDLLRTGTPLAALFWDCDVALVAAGGFAGLSYTLAAIEAGKDVALANKESLVCGGELVTAAARRKGVEIIPVDSEHSALFQALSFRRDAAFSRLVLTASGGPFLHASEEQLAGVTAADALKHPTWNMGAKITVDSATMLNKGYEVIEAKWLYNAEFSQIDAVVHPESIVHSLVYFQDGAALAQLGYPDMRVPIQLALTYPGRMPCAPQLKLEEIGALHFLPLPKEKFPCFTLALQAGEAGGTCPCILNAAGEEAVKAFLQDGITFPKIAETIRGALNEFACERVESYAQLSEIDARVRKGVRRKIYGE